MWISLALIIFAIAVQVRNQWVFNWRNKLNRFENGVHVISEYIDYDAMMIRFWVWDIAKLKVTNAKASGGFGIDCPQCNIEQPKRIPTMLLPGQRCKVCGYKDPRQKEK